MSKDNPRQSFDEEGLRRLGESIKSHGQLQPIVVRKKGSLYELVVGERRLRACALVGLTEIEAEVRDVDDVTAMELRLIENTQREDLTDAEKGDAVLALWANYDKYETIKDVAEAINIPLGTVQGHWIPKARKLSPTIRELGIDDKLDRLTTKQLLKYSHSIQDKLGRKIVEKELSQRQAIQFLKLYDVNPQRPLDEIADEVKGIKKVEIPEKFYSPELRKKIEQEKEQYSKVQRIRKKPSKPITKQQVKEKLAKKKTDFKFVKAKITRGTGNAPSLKQQIQPNIIPNPDAPDYTLCQCAMCPLFAKHCKGRCWT